MKITKLVVLFNYEKIILGIIVSIIAFILSYFLENKLFKISFVVVGTIILLNISASIVASYILYDKSDLYKLHQLEKIVNLKKAKNVVLIHASFDPISSKLQKKYPSLNFTICDIYGNRHEHDKGIHVSKKIFPPNIHEIKIHPDQLPFEDTSQDVILAITAIHEVLKHETRVDFFKESERILNDGGTLIISEQFRDLTNFIFFNIGAFHFLSEKMWKKAIRESGLKIVGNKKITPFVNMLIIKKDVN